MGVDVEMSCEAEAHEPAGMADRLLHGHGRPAGVYDIVYDNGLIALRDQVVDAFSPIIVNVELNRVGQWLAGAFEYTQGLPGLAGGFIEHLELYMRIPVRYLHAGGDHGRIGRLPRVGGDRQQEELPFLGKLLLQNPCEGGLDIWVRLYLLAGLTRDDVRVMEADVKLHHRYSGMIDSGLSSSIT